MFLKEATALSLALGSGPVLAALQRNAQWSAGTSRVTESWT